MKKGERIREATGGNAGPLRKRAEALVKKRFGKAEPEELSAAEARRLVHELRTHQVEIEIQNEELRDSQIALEESKRKYADLYDMAPVGYFSFDRKGIVLEANLTGAAMLGIERGRLIGSPFVCFIINPGAGSDTVSIFHNHLGRVITSGERQTCEVEITRKDGTKFIAHLESVPCDSAVRTAISDINERKRAEKERERLIGELQEALSKVKLLSGVIPICSTCKKIRNDKGYWEQVEVYIRDHSLAQFTHGMCESCAKEALGGLAKLGFENKD